jgi:glycosyltransferase involved in cell wall biosynthesis
LHISPSGRIYGTERHILSIVKYSDKNKFEHTVATPDRGVFNEELDRLGIKNEIAGRQHGYKSKVEGIFNKDALKLLRLIRKGGFDIVHTHLNSFGGFMAKLAGVKRIIHTRHGVFWSDEELENISASDKKFQNIKNKVFDITVAIGNYEKETLINKLGYDPAKIRVTINGVNIEEIDSKTDKTKTKAELFGTEDFIAGAVGRLERQKGFHYLVEAARLVCGETDKIKFVIIGEGSYKEQLMKMRDGYGLTDKIIFIDYKNNVPDYVNRFDIKVLTSLWEGLSYAVQEAMALAKPVIALSSKNVSGVKEIIVNGKTGYLIEDDYEKNLAKYILELYNDNEKRLAMGMAGRERELKDFPERRTAEDMDKVYLELFGNKK